MSSNREWGGELRRMGKAKSPQFIMQIEPLPWAEHEKIPLSKVEYPAKALLWCDAHTPLCGFLTLVAPISLFGLLVCKSRPQRGFL